MPLKICNILSTKHSLLKQLDQRTNRNLEAAIGIEPMNKGFADLRLTTWLRRLKNFVSSLRIQRVLAQAFDQHLRDFGPREFDGRDFTAR